MGGRSRCSLRSQRAKGGCQVNVIREANAFYKNRRRCTDASGKTQFHLIDHGPKKFMPALDVLISQSPLVEIRADSIRGQLRPLGIQPLNCGFRLFCRHDDAGESAEDCCLAGSWMGT